MDVARVIEGFGKSRKLSETHMRKNVEAKAPKNAKAAKTPMTPKTPKTPKTKPGAADAITAYATTRNQAEAAICKALRKEIDKALPHAESRVWHGAPVWFVGVTPVVGYNSVAKGGVSLLFWNGRALGDAALSPVGKFMAAQFHYDDVAAIDARSLRRWLEKAGTNLWDHSALPMKGPRRQKT